jgi:hypothetical protein
MCLRRGPRHGPRRPSAGAASPDRAGGPVNPVVNATSGRLSLRPPQRAALEVLARMVELAPPAKGMDVGAALETVRAEFPAVTSFEREFPSLCFALATGVGKTRLMGAFIGYLYRGTSPTSILSSRCGRPTRGPWSSSRSGAACVCPTAGAPASLPSTDSRSSPTTGSRRSSTTPIGPTRSSGRGSSSAGTSRRRRPGRWRFRPSSRPCFVREPRGPRPRRARLSPIHARRRWPRRRWRPSASSNGCPPPGTSSGPRSRLSSPRASRSARHRSREAYRARTSRSTSPGWWGRRRRSTSGTRSMCLASS